MISNSYGAREFGGTQAYSAAYDHPGHVIVASSGDAGFTAANFPANLATVVAAGAQSWPGPAMPGNASKITPGYEYRHAGLLFDVTKGNNIFGDGCGRDYMCVARKGYDAPTGLGTPDGTGAF